MNLLESFFYLSRVCLILRSGLTLNWAVEGKDSPADLPLLPAAVWWAVWEAQRWYPSDPAHVPHSPLWCPSLYFVRRSDTANNVPRHHQLSNTSLPFLRRTFQGVPTNGRAGKQENTSTVRGSGCRVEACYNLSPRWLTNSSMKRTK